MAKPPQKRQPQKPNNKPRYQTPPSPKKNADGETIYKISGMAYNGYGVAKARKITFIPYTIEGEEITAEIVREDGNVSYAEGLSLVKASQDRVFPVCDHFGAGKCWGCQWQHVDYKAQVLMKFDVWLSQLYRHGNMTDKTLERLIQPVISSPDEWGYNHHATFRRGIEGEFGFLRQDGRTVQQIEFCHTLHPDVQNAYESLDIDFEDMKSFTLSRGHDGNILLQIAMSSEQMPELNTDLPFSVNVILPDNEPVNLFGDTFVQYEVNGRVFRATAGSFFRANVGQIPQLVGTILEMLALKGDEAVLELYAGVGVLSAFIAPHVELLTTVESYPPAVTDADENLAEFDNVDVVEGSTEEFLEELLAEGARYDAIVIDTPPQGLTQPVIDAIHDLSPQKIVLVANNLNAFWGGLFGLMRGGYTPTRLQPIDFSPQTSYVESVAVLVKARSN